MESDSHGGLSGRRLILRRRPFRSAAIFAAALLASVAAAAARNDGPFEARLTDPRDGRSARVEPAPSVLHLVFLATWCEPCLDELDRLVDLEDRWRDRGYRLLVVAVRHRQDPERVQALLEERPVPGTVVIDSFGDLEKGLSVERLPTHLLLDGQGRVIFRGEEIDDALAEAVGAAVAGGPR